MGRRGIAVVAGVLLTAGGVGFAQQGDDTLAPMPRSSAGAPATAAPAASPKPSGSPSEREIMIYGRPGAAPARTPRPKRVPVAGSVAAKCSTTLVDAFFAPTQGVWQDDIAFRTKTPQLVRAGDGSYRAGLDMVAGRATVLAGAGTFVDAAGETHAAGDRHRILLTVRTDCSTNGKVRADFELKQRDNVPAHFDGETVPAEIPLAPPRLPDGRTRTLTLSVDAAQGFPADRTFTFTAGPWTLKSALLRENGSAVGGAVEVSGRAINTTAPVTSFAPISFLPSQGNFALVSGEAAYHAEGFARWMPDYLPLAPGAIRAPVLPPLVVLSGGSLPAVGEGISPRDRLAAAAADRLELLAFLTNSDRVVGVVDDEEWSTLFTDPVDAAETAGLAVGDRAVLVRASGSPLSDAHELLHTVPSFGWGSAGTMAECGRNVHDADGLASGLRLTSAGQPAMTRREVQFGAGLFSHPVPGLAPDVSTFVDKCTWAHLLAAWQTPAREQRVRLIRGVVVRQDDGHLLGALGPFYDIGGVPNMTPVKANTPPPPDTWTFLTLDAKGKPIETYFFKPTWRYEDDRVPDRATVPFSFRLPWRNEVREVQLIAPTAQTADKRKMVANPPSLTITAPFNNASVRAHGGRVTIAWAARGTSGGSVYYSLFDSTDDGVTWMPIAVEVGDVHLDIPAANGRHRVKVVVTDSASSREALVNFTVR